MMSFLRLPTRPAGQSEVRKLLLAQEKEVGVAARTRIHNGRQIVRNVVGVAAADQRESERQLHGNLWWSDQLSLVPVLPVNRDIVP